MSNRKIIQNITAVLALLCFYNSAFAQKKSRYNIAVISPLYLDSVDFNKDLVNIPSYALTGLDFYQGARLAADTLDKLGLKVNMYVYDGKSKYNDLHTLIMTDKLDSMDCIIGNVGGEDVRTLANFAKQHKIIFLSAVSPNDAEQTDNPFFVMLQSKLNTHIERLQKRVQLAHISDNVIFAYGSQPQEINAFNYFNSITPENVSKPAEYKLQAGSSIPESMLSKEKKNVIVMALLDAKAAYKQLQLLDTLVEKGYSITVYGMPTWENIKALKDANDLKNIEVAYTSPLVVSKSSVAAKYIIESYKQKMGGMPGDNAYKGFEAMYFASMMLNRYGGGFQKYFASNPYTFLIPYKLQENAAGKFFENKYLYLVKYRNGVFNYE